MEPQTQAVTEVIESVSLVSRLREAVASGNRLAALTLAARASDADAEHLFESLSPAETTTLFELLGDERFADLIVHLDDSHAADVLELISVERAADVLEELDPDDATDIFSELEPEHGSDILVEMEPDEAQEIRDLLAYPPDTAGGIMTPAFVSIAPTLRADQAIAALRKVAEEAETINYVYVTDSDDHLLGVLSLHRLVLTSPETTVDKLMFDRTITVPVTADQEDAARTLMEHELLALPVVDDENRVLGIITVDDIAELLEAEATEDIERLGGSQPLDVAYRRAGVTLLFRRRIVWLLLLFAAEAYTGTVLRHFEDEIAQVVTLAFFIPLLIGTGGNVGSQVTTTLVRAMAVGEVRLRDVRWVLGKEVTVGLVIGAVMAVAAFGRSQLLHVGSDVGFVIAVSIIAICIWSAAVAAVLPLLLQRLRIDPAVVSAPLITTLVDGTGLVIYFTLAKYMLDL
jgi:magnesium transporter